MSDAGDQLDVSGLRSPDQIRSGSRGDHAELCQLGEDVDDRPGLGYSPFGEAEDNDLFVRDGPAGWWDAHVFALMGAGDRVAHDDLVALLDQILDRDV